MKMRPSLTVNKLLRDACQSTWFFQRETEGDWRWSTYFGLALKSMAFACTSLIPKEKMVTEGAKLNSVISMFPAIFLLWTAPLEPSALAT